MTLFLPNISQAGSQSDPHLLMCLKGKAQLLVVTISKICTKPNKLFLEGNRQLHLYPLFHNL